MSQLRWHRVLGTGFCLVAMLFLAASVSAGRKAEQLELQDYQKIDLQSLVQVVRGALDGTTQPTEKPFAFSNDFLKGTEGNTYVPFTLVFDPSKFPTSAVAMYLFVTKHMDAAAPVTPPATPPPGDTPPASATPPAREAAFEDAYFVDLSDQQGQPQARVSRAFSVPGGEYDVYVAMRNSAPPVDGAEPPPPQIVMQMERVAVPELWAPALTTSTIILAETVEGLSAALTPEQQVANPYTLGTTRIVPKSKPEFAKTEEMQMLFLVYNPELKEGKPDVTVEYNFYQRKESAEEFFNKTNPQRFNAQTLPPEFDVAAGHQIVAGQSIPMRLFPDGQYRLEIKIIDNVSGSTVTKNVNFAVLPA